MLMLTFYGSGDGDLSYLYKTDEKQCQEHRKHMSNEKWCDYNTINIVTFSLLLQMEK